MKTPQIVKPIFIVSMPRSGSSVFYQKFSTHPDLCWTSHDSKKFPRSAVLSRIIQKVRPDPRPTEGHRIWRRFAREEDDSMRREHVIEEQKRYYHDLIRAQLRIFGKSRFISKYPRNCLRLDWIDEIFPDAIFVHLVRDGRAVALSLLRKRDTHEGRPHWWGIRPPGWKNFSHCDPIESVAQQWKACVTYTRTLAADLPPQRYGQFRYEDFCAAPADTLERVAALCDLKWPDRAALEQLVSNIDTQNYKWGGTFSENELERMESVMGDLLEELGYPCQSLHSPV